MQSPFSQNKPDIVPLLQEARRLAAANRLQPATPAASHQASVEWNNAPGWPAWDNWNNWSNH